MTTLRELDANALIRKLDAHFKKLCNDTTYVSRLGKENNWDFQYTVRVIEEYKKFLFIFGFTHQAVSPPHPIDEAWHTHILYTRDYFEDLTKILGKAFHHQPEGPQKSADEQKYLRNAYDSTIAEYRKYFGIEPSDIWTVNKSRNYSIPNYEYLKRIQGVPKERSLWDKILGNSAEIDELAELEKDRYDRSLKNYQVDNIYKVFDLRKKRLSDSSYQSDNVMIDYLILDPILDVSMYDKHVEKQIESTHKCGATCSNYSHSSHSHSHESVSHSDSTHSHSCSSHSCSSSDSGSSSSCGGGGGCGGGD